MSTATVENTPVHFFDWEAHPIVHSWENMTARESHGENYTGADMRHCNAVGGSFTTCQMFNANMHRSSFSEVDFSYSMMFGSILTKARFTNCRMYGTSLSKANCQNASFRGSYLRKTDFIKANLRNADFTDVHIDETMFTGANITGAIMSPETYRYAMIHGAIDDNSVGITIFDKVMNFYSKLMKRINVAPRVVESEAKTSTRFDLSILTETKVIYKEEGWVLRAKEFVQHWLDVDRLLDGRK